MKMRGQRLSSALLAASMVAAVTPFTLAASDVEGHWAQSAMEEFIEKGWLKGYGNGQYGPNDPLTGSQFVALLERVSGLAAQGGDSEAVITRQEAVVLVADLLELNGGQVSTLERFTDMAQISTDAQERVAAMVEAGYVQGSDNGSFLPGKELTRAEGITILHNTLDALTSAIPTTGTIYGTATLTYGEFYSGDVSSTDSYGIDGVTSATVSKYSIMSNMATNFTEDKTEGYNILGVQNVNVAVDAADYQAYVALEPTFLVSRAVPEQYKAVTIQDGKAVYSATKFNVKATVTDAGATLKTGSTWGDYEIDVSETSTQYIRNDRSDDWAVNSKLQGVILEGIQTDGTSIKVGLEHLQSLWVQPYEVSFNVSADSAQNAHIAGWDNLPELQKLVGATITSMTYIMPEGTYAYHFENGIYIKPAYQGSAVVSASFTEGSDQVVISNVPAQLEDVTVTVSYGSGRTAVTVVSGATPENGVVTMSAVYDKEQTYTVKISSSNYADLVAAVSMSQAQRTQLEDLTGQAKALVENGTAANDSGLLEHYQEALELLAQDSATTAQAAELISELTSHLSVYSN